MLIRGARRRIAALTGLAGAALAVAPFVAPSAGAGINQVAGYNASSLARGIEVRGGIRNIVTDPLIAISAPFTRTEMSSLPESAAIATVLFPGDLAYSVLKEDGVAPSQGLPASWPAADAHHPDRPERTFTIRPSTEQLGLGIDIAKMTAHAKDGANDALVQASGFEYRPNPAEPPLVRIATVETVSTTKLTLTGVEQLAEVRASRIELLGGAITIEEALAHTRSLSDVTGRSVSEADVRLIDARVRDTSNRTYRAVIDQNGIRIEDPTINDGLEQGLNQALEASLGRLGVEISGVDRSSIVDEDVVDSAATALVLNFNAVCESCSAVPAVPVDPRDHVPDEVRDPYNQVTCVAQNVNTSLPCLTVQLIPAPNSQFKGTITVGGARAVSAASAGFSFDVTPPGGGGFDGGGFDGGFTPPSGPGGGLGSFGPGTAPQPGPGNAPAAPPAATGRAVALRAEMPDWGLALAGAFLLAFALSLVVGPSLRRGTAG